MANFPIQRASGTLPSQGPNVYWNVDTRTGEQFVARAMGQLGEGVMGVGLLMNRLQADTELADAIMADQQAIQELAIGLEGNTDPHTYDEAFNKTLETIQGREIKNGLAAREHSLFVKRMTPKWQAGLAGAKKARIESNFMASLFQAETAAIQGGSLTGYQLLLQDGVEAGILGKDEAAKRLHKTRHAAERRMLEETAMTDPEAALEFADHFLAGDVVGFDTIDSMDVRDIQNIAQGQQAYNNRKFDKQQSAAYGQVFAAAADPNMTPPKMHKLLTLSNLPPEKQDEFFQMYMRVWRNLKAGEADPFKTTQDYPALLNMDFRIAQGVPTTEMDVWRDMNAGGMPRYSRADALGLIRKLPDNLKDANRALLHYLDETEKDIDGIFLAGKKISEIPPEAQQQWAIVRRDAERIIETNWPNIAAAQKELDVLLAPYRKKQSKGLLRWWWDLSFPESALAKWGMTEAEMYRGIGRWIGEAGETKVGEPK